MNMKYKLIILDRDGVINYDSDAYIKSSDEWVPIPGSLEKIAAWCRQGLQVALASNQSGVARGLFSQGDLTLIHQKMSAALAQLGGKFAATYYCQDHPNNPTHFRKPNPGMLLAAMEDVKVSPEESLFIGDSFTDYEASLKAGCDFILVKTGKGERTLSRYPDLADKIPVVASLKDIELT